jgi:hypothetical protein
MTGEGNLARLYIEKNYNNKCKIYTVKKIFSNKKVIKILNYKYISPLVGIIFCWYKFTAGKKNIYLNYLPLWNSLLFMLLPPKTIFGPITGGANYGYGKQFLIRNYIFPILFKISNIFLNFRKIEIYFSTDLLKKYLLKSIINKSHFNFVLNYVKKKKKERKKIDLLIYFRKHTNKEKFFPYDFVNGLAKKKIVIDVIGDYLNIDGVNNLGYLTNKEVNSRLSRTKYTLISGENFYSIFILECISNNVKILIESKFKNSIKHYRNSFLFINFKRNFDLKKNTIN